MGKRALRELSGFLDGELAGADPATIEREGLRRATELITGYVEPWRTERADALQHGIDELDARLSTELDAALAAIRPAARDLLGLELSVPPSGLRLVTDPRFFYLFSPGVDVTSVIAGAVRRRLPGEIGRRRARRHVLDDASSLAPQQMGRARADLQQRLAETERRFGRALAERYGDYAARLTEALRNAEQLSVMGDAERTVARCALADREHELHRLATTISRISGMDRELSGGQQEAGEPRPG